MNFAAGNATVRYDETLLEVADIKVLVHQRVQQPADAEPKPPRDAPASVPAPTASAGGGKSAQAPPSIPGAAEPKPPTKASAASLAPAPAAPPADEHKDHAEPGALDKVTAWVRDTIVGEDKPEDKPEQKPGAKPTPEAAPASASPPKPAMPKAAPAASATAPKPPAPAGDGQQGKGTPAAPPSTPVAAKEE